jgi:hypothetical protein
VAHALPTTTHDRKEVDRMNVSKLLGATMVAGALATGGAVAGIAGAAAAPGESASTTSQSSATTTPSTGSTEQPSTPKSGGPGKHPCPNMGAHQRGSAAEGGSASGAAYPAAPAAGVTAQ